MILKERRMREHRYDGKRGTVDRREQRPSRAGVAGVGRRFETHVRTRSLDEVAAGIFARKIQLQLMRGNFEAAAELVAEARRAACGEAEEQPVAAVDTPLADLVSVRTAQALERELFVIFAGHVLHFTDEQLLAIPNFGPVALAEVDEALARLNLKRWCKEPGA